MGNDWPRVWWIPTGLLSQVPLHAAGYHAWQSRRSVMDRVMSSYSLLIRQLIYRNRNLARRTTVPTPEQTLLIAMRKTPGLPTNQILPFVDDEVEMLKRLFPSLNLSPIIPKPVKSDVLRYLKTSSIVHFAGHGRWDRMNPEQSRLLLEDWQTHPLTVGDLRDQQLQMNPSFLGYLSACSTGANSMLELQDEGVNLINALQLAGFRHVIGTLWEVSDKYCVDVSKVVYGTISEDGMVDRAVCRGLHPALRALRGGEGKDTLGGRDGKLLGFGSQKKPSLETLYWIPYVHFGV